jgi:ribose transport system ATP-binding protein
VALSSSFPAGSMAPLLEVRQISKCFGPTQALHNASLRLEAGEIHALVGENGAGKSTLMKILSGVHRKDSGQVLLDGADVNPQTPQEARSLGIGTVFQELSLCNNLSVAENIFANREPGSFGLVNYRQLNRLTHDHLREFQFAIPAETLVGDLTLAHKQIVEILKAMALKARVLILDEPTSALERTDVAKLFELLSRLKAQGTGTLKSTETNRDAIINFMVGREIHQIYPRKASARGKERLKVSNFCLHDAFEGITFQLLEGEILGVAGLTGSGRSEVMQSIFAYRGKDSGTIDLEEVPIDIDSPSAAISQGIVYSPEDRKEQGLFLNHSVAMNVTSACLEECSTSILLSKRKERDVATSMVHRPECFVAERGQSAESTPGKMSGVQTKGAHR